MVVFQSTFLSIIRFLDQTPLLLVLGAIAWGMIRGPYEGLVWAFVAGFLLDLFSIAPWGVNTLAMIGAMLLAVFIVSTLSPRRFWLPAVIGGLCAVVFLFLSVALIFLTPFGNRGPNIPNIGTFFFVQSVTMLPIYWGLYFLDRLVPQITPDAS